MLDNCSTGRWKILVKHVHLSLITKIINAYAQPIIDNLKAILSK